MKSTGIIRRVDGLGRIVIPKEIRTTMKLREGDPLELFTGAEGELILRKYSPMGGIDDFAINIVDSIYLYTGIRVAVCNRDSVIALPNMSKTELSDMTISPRLEKLMEDRTVYRYAEGDRTIPLFASTRHFPVGIAAPIIVSGDVVGCVAVLDKANRPLTTLAKTVADLLSRQTAV